MPKLKTHSGTKDRVKITKTGKLLMRKASGNHLLEHKSTSRKRTFAGLQSLGGRPAKNLKLKLGK
jgi:large subunit ribosomal protein L35